ncbi:MAG TPA: HEAT repeat domain-containing protein [Chloroflexi bacterium]|nr:HEAT repeat domain-containing protein [Chloroflexota bacterium]
MRMRSIGDDFAELLANLLDAGAPLRAALIYRLSEPMPEELALVQAEWGNVPVERRRLLMARLAEASEVAFDLDFSAIATFALQDPDAEVRKHAIETLWESEHPALMRLFIELLQTDSDSRVRAAAAISLGRFVLAGELGTLPEATAREAEEALLCICQAGEDALEVRRRALESLAFSGRAEVAPLIEEASRHDDLKMRASALLAMGRSADERWGAQVLRALDSREAELRFEAAHAAGELGLQPAIPRLVELAHEPDREIKEAAIWALGEIGGPDAEQALYALIEREADESLIESIEDALSMAALMAGEFAPLIFSLGDEEDDLLDFEDPDIEDDLG